MLLFVFGFAKKWMERDDGWEKKSRTYKQRYNAKR